MTKLQRIARLRYNNYPTSDIAAVLGITVQELRALETGRDRTYYDLRSTFASLMRRVPHWWQGTAEAYYACVRSNFADVLE